MKTTKDNQMKICFLPTAEFNRLWEKMMPSDRITTNLPTLCIYYYRLNTLFIAGARKDFLAEKEDILNTQMLTAVLGKGIV